MAPPRKYYDPICSVDGCNNPSRYKGLCKKHYKRQWRHGDPKKTLLNMEGGTCTIAGCNRPRKMSNGYCAVHYLRFSRHGRLHTIIAEPGKGTLTNAGYRLITVNGKRQYEHIYLAEKALGKSLPQGAVVHHVNENTSDNFTPFNLIVCPNQAYHRLLHERARELKTKEAFVKLGLL